MKTEIERYYKKEKESIFKGVKAGVSTALVIIVLAVISYFIFEDSGYGVTFAIILLTTVALVSSPIIGVMVTTFDEDEAYNNLITSTKNYLKNDHGFVALESLKEHERDANPIIKTRVPVKDENGNRLIVDLKILDGEIVLFDGANEIPKKLNVTI